MTKEEITQYEQFLLLPQCFPILVIVYQFNFRYFLYFDKICSKSSAAELSYEGQGVKDDNSLTDLHFNTNRRTVYPPIITHKGNIKNIKKLLWTFCFSLVDGGWSSWNNYGACSKTCGTGSESRGRTCSNPEPANGGAVCVGETDKTRNCNTKPCPGITSSLN